MSGTTTAFTQRPPHGLTGCRVTVMGLGRFGGGLGVTRYLCSQGAQVLLTDVLSAVALEGPLTQLAPLIEAGRVHLRLDGHADDDFTAADLVVGALPWVAWTAASTSGSRDRQARRRGSTTDSYPFRVPPSHRGLPIASER